MEEIKNKDFDNVNPNIDLSNNNLSKNKNIEPPKYIDSFIYTLLSIFGIAFLTFTLIFQIILQPIKVVGTSMQPSINVSVSGEDDENHCDVVFYKDQNTYNTNDIVIIKNSNYVLSNNEKVSFIIKRVIALPNQTVKFVKEKIENGKLFYKIIVLDEFGNDTKYIDNHKKEDMNPTIEEIQKLCNLNLFPIYKSIFEPLANNTANETTYKVPQNSYFVMGDNRNNSDDSRFFGAVKQKDIEGSVVLHVPYGENIWVSIYKKIKSLI